MKWYPLSNDSSLMLSLSHWYHRVPNHRESSFQDKVRLNSNASPQRQDRSYFNDLYRKLLLPSGADYECLLRHVHVLITLVLVPLHHAAMTWQQLPYPQSPRIPGQMLYRSIDWRSSPSNIENRHPARSAESAVTNIRNGYHWSDPVFISQKLWKYL